MLNLRQLQADMLSWQNWNFPKTTAFDLMMGINEEIGELARAVRLGSPSLQRDAIGDICVFGINCLTKLGITIEDVLGTPLGDPLEFSEYPYQQFLIICEYGGRLSHAMLKVSQGIRGQTERNIKEQFAKLWFSMAHFAKLEKFDFYENLSHTWDEVRRRDWKLYPKNGLSE